MRVSTDRPFFHKASWAIAEHHASRHTEKFYRDIPREEVEYLHYNYETDEEVSHIEVEPIQQMHLDDMSLYQVKTTEGNLWFVYNSEYLVQDATALVEEKKQ